MENKKKYLLAAVGVVLLGVLGYLFWPVTPAKPPEPLPIALPPPPPQPPAPPAQPTPPPPEPQPTTPVIDTNPYILSLSKTKAGWVVRLNKYAMAEAKKGSVIRLHIGYCWYQSGKITKNRIVIKPTWNPPEDKSRISAGLYNPKTNKYISAAVRR